MHDHTSYLTYDLHAHLIILCYGKALKKEGTFVYKEITSYRGFDIVLKIIYESQLFWVHLLYFQMHMFCTRNL